ncbi:MAG: EamA family transporter RarD [Pseudomonadota bacterium]
MSNSPRSGVLYAAGAFFIWGAVPIYFKALRSVSPFEVISHRVVWSVLFLLLLLRATTGFTDLRTILREPRLLARLTLTSALIACNWLVFVWAVNADRVLDTSLGYYITPLMNVLFGFLFLKERLRPAQQIAVVLVIVGVANQIWQLGLLPWVSLVLAVTFGCYGLLRKQTQVDAVNGLLVEILVATPFAVAYLVYSWHNGTAQFRHQSFFIDTLLVLAGVITAIPLLMFAAGAKRLRLATLGFLQYLAPSMTFLLAVFVYGEPFGHAQAITFVFIWSGLIVYSLDTWRVSRV